MTKTFDLPTLMSTKIRTILYRKREKTDARGNIVAKVKGRDYFDLMWYLQKGVRPNLQCLKEFKNVDELKKELLTSVINADARSIKIDLESLIDDDNFVKNLSNNIKKIIEVKIKEALI